MSSALPTRVARALHRGILALLVCLSLTILPSQADAATAGCRGDPIIYLSNGAKIQIFVAVTVDAASVTSVTYNVHIPAGLTATKIVLEVPTPSSLPGIPTSKEKVYVYADLAAKQYRTSTQIMTTSTATATVTGIFTPSSTATSTSLTASGATGTALPINYTAP